MNCPNKVNYCFTYPWNFNVIKHYTSLNLKEGHRIFRKKTRFYVNAEMKNLSINMHPTIKILINQETLEFLLLHVIN